MNTKMKSSLLTDRYSYEKMKEILSENQPPLFPAWQDREAWDQLPEEAKQICIEEAEKYIGYDWPALPASLYMEFSINGNRSRYEQPYFARRTALAALTIAECIEGRKRFMEDIVNGIWAICEETTWVIPAHSNSGYDKYGQKQPLPDIDDPLIDLFAAETGALMAFVYALLREPLEHVSPIIADRIKREMELRILTPFLTGNFWWMSFNASAGHAINNWNPWCNSNCLTAFLLMEEDETRKLEAVYKGMRSIDRFISSYGEDGGCDEGPSYWNRAGGSLFDCLELLRLATNGQCSMYDVPLIQERGKYIAKVHIADHYFVNYADGSAIIGVSAPRVYLYGKQIGDPAMTSLGLRFFHENPAKHITGMYSILHRLIGLFAYEEMKHQPAQHVILRDAWMGNLEVMCAREHESSEQGLFISAKGGHNNESHNHNDVGNFILYCDGRPVLIDAGVETYTAKTFSSERYTIWTMQSSYHNLPEINGYGQQAGANYRSKNAAYRVDDDKAEMELDIAGAYPEEAGISSWHRLLRLNRGANASFELIEQVKFHAETKDVKLHFMTAVKPKQSADGQIVLEPGNGSDALMFQFDPELFASTLETIEITDRNLMRCWGNKIYRMILTLKRPVREEKWNIRIERM